MAHFAEIDSDNKVLRVLVVPDEQEHRGQEYLNEIGIPGTWIQTSYNANIRGKFAGTGDIYDPINDVFLVGPQNSYTDEDVIDVEEVTPTPALEG